MSAGPWLAVKGTRLLVGRVARAASARAMQRDLAEAVRQGRLELHFQPQVRSDDLRRLHGAEALLRWRHPVQGPVPPDQVVARAEALGLGDDLLHGVLSQACAQLAQWRDRGVAVPAVSVNVSAGNLLDRGLPERVARTLARHRLQPGMLTLELTEHMPIVQRQRSEAAMHALRELGVRLSVDDLGSGHAGFDHLSLPIDEIKLDKSLVLRAGRCRVADALLKALLGMGRELGLGVVAEGVETAGQLRFLREHGCPVLQGYLLSPPLPPQALADWLAAR